MMRELLLTRLSFVWLLLMAATAVSWWLAATPAASTAAQSSSIMMLLVAFFKVRLVVMYFMEARHAPRALRWSGEAAVAGICSLVILFYVYGEQLVAAGFPVS